MIDAKTAKLRILSLAFRGKLVNYSRKEKQNASLESLHKAQKSFLAVSEAECLTDIPSYWNWSRLGYVTNNHGQTVPDKDFCYIDVGTLDNVHQRLAAAENLVTAKNAPSRARKVVHFGDVLYSTVRPYLHNICIVDREFSRTPIASTAFCVMHANDSVLVNKFLFYWLLTKEFDAFSNGDSSKGTLYPAIGEKDLLQGVIPIPPLAEQHRIVARIEQAFSALDTIDALQAKYADNLAVLKSKLIDAAIQGKLTEQLPEDGTADELYRQIQAEKQALIKSGKIKKEKPLPEIAADEVPFEIPKSWKWVRLGTILSVQPSNGYSPQSVGYQTPYKNLTLTATTSGYFKADAFKYVSITPEVAEKYYLENDDILVQRSNSRDLVGTSCIFRYGNKKFIYPDLMMRIHVMEGINTDFIDYVLKAPLSRAFFKKEASGTSESMPKINQATVRNALIPLPPLAEQKRIVKRLDEVLKLVETGQGGAGRAAV